MMKNFLTTALMASMLVTTSAQAQTYQWEEDYCSYKGNFDSKKYTANQIKNSHDVLQNLNRLNLDGFKSPQNPSAVNNLSNKDLTSLNKEYSQLKNKIENLSVVPQAKVYKQQLLKTIEGEYTQDKLELLAYINPAEAIKQSPAMCRTYIEPLLQSETAIQNRWLKAVEENIKEQAKDYADDREFAESQRQIAMQRYQEEKATNAPFYARKDLISYHFTNCVNSQMYRADPEVVFTNIQKLNKTLFGRSFKEMCEAP
ncbi:hypothetical protein [Psychrobacter sanguinis]|uniref:hypothetical protein n=1 Tax=Psychrobacter sanguinis TaxID=861445 RepID=UPI0028A06AEF|nr:hypothetical protein [Psychrobacter sanguinis]